jgi:transglutaminase-like putative cysteine protease
MKHTFVCLVMVLGLLEAGFGQQGAEKPAPLKFPYEPSNAIIRYDSTMAEVKADGRSVVRKHYRVAVLTDRAIRNYAQDVTTYNLGYDTVIVLTAKVHLPSGKVVDVMADSDAIKDVPVPAFGKFFLQNVREKIITFPELQQGAEIEVAYTEITHDTPMDGQFELSEGFEDTDPMQVKYVEIAAPASMKFKWKAHGHGTIPYTEKKDGDFVHHMWTVENVPQFAPEPGMPPAPEVLQQLMVTTVPDWQTWSRWYQALSESCITADESVRKQAHELADGEKTSEDKLRKIFYYCSNDIRYVETALTGRKAGYKPAAAATTLSNKYGVCRDKAALMVSMLREVGIPADITLMNPSWKIDGSIPVDQFNHAIVAVQLNGHTQYVDPTVEKIKDFLSAQEQDRAVLVCNKKGEDLAWTPLEPADRNLYQIQAESRLAEDGTFRSDVTITTMGLPDHVMRDQLRSLPPEKRTRLFRQLVQKIHPTAQLDSVQTSDPQDYSKAVTIHLTFHADAYTISAGKYLLFQVPGQSAALDFLSSALLRGSDLVNRRFDLRLPSTFAVKVQEHVTYPAGYKVRSLPDNVDMNYGDFRLARDFEAQKNSVTVRRAMTFSTLNVPLSNYGKLRELLHAGSAMARGQVVLVKG